MKYLFLLIFLFWSSGISLQEYIVSEGAEFNFSIKDYQLFENGDCVEHNFDSQIRYAISGKQGSRYQLVVWQDNLPRSMVMGLPTHSSDIVIGKMFHKIDCKTRPEAFTYEIYEDSFDPYMNATPVFRRYM